MERHLLHSVRSQSKPRRASDLISYTLESSIKAWETALSCLPTENLSAGDNALKEQFQAGLEDTKAALAKQFHSRPFIGIADSDVSMKALPWFKAEAMTEELSQAKNFTSSVCLQF